ncbi:hypothetical protein [Larkinella rosea]|uniref:Bacterial toxin 23 domain-containing protein n=1 Tax=Larkinella rosea TaxID=2025312 RepID=A0A3P1BTJ8_9BACT|nr:hypothetical protein [Larkinella rosea]RRB04438.1 hypothetical protein EHT25_13140 [Larkinella rosea]
MNPRCLYLQKPARHGVWLLLLVGLITPVQTIAQIDFNPPGKGTTHVNLKIGGYFLIYGGFGFSAGVGFWTSYKHLQPSCNLSVNVIGNKASLGNRDRYLTDWQINTVLTPMLTYGRGQGLYQEINPFYFGTQGTVYANYQHSVTLGSNFIVMPRSLGRNITTFRNRTQQLVYIGLRFGAKDWDVNVNLYEDFLPFTDTPYGQALADNYDRFYTGGGNIQFRTRYLKIKQYSDVYTGTASRDLFDSPDLYHPYKTDFSKQPTDSIGRGPRRRHPRYVALDPGQKLFNKGRDLTVIELSPNLFGWNGPFDNHPTLQVYGGWQGGKNQMWSQNLIHNAIKIDKINPTHPEPDQLRPSARKQGQQQDRYHRFFPAYTKSRFITGAGLIFNTIPRISTP